MEKRLISGILQRAGLNAFKISSITDKENVGKIFQRLAEHRVNIEFVNQIPLKNATIDIVLCVDNKDAQSTRALLEEAKAMINARTISPLDSVGILSLFPHREHALISGAIMQVLSGAHIPLVAMASSISAISCVIKEEQIPNALTLLSRQFSLS
jgi:aspartokinase